MMGNNLGLLASADYSQTMLAAMGKLLRPGGMIVAIGTNPYLTEDPSHVAYQQRNRERDRMSGQIRLRVRYQMLMGEWFDYLLASPDELGELAARAGWRVADITEPDPSYLAELRPTR